MPKTRDMISVFRGIARPKYKNQIKILQRYQYCNEECSPAPVIKDVPGLSNKVLDVPQEEVGPGASKNATYKNPEYFSYHNGSYFEAEVEMMKYRLPQPSNKSCYK